MNTTNSQLEAVQKSLAAAIDPNTGKPFAKAIKNLSLDQDSLSFEVVLGYPAAKSKAVIQSNLISLAKSLGKFSNVSANVYSKITAHAVQRGVKLLPGVKNIIAVASGKGGVGKSTTAVNIALALQQAGASVGILDADIYGPSLPTMLGIADQQPEPVDEHRLQPLKAYGLQAMSIGFMIEADSPMIWRGPMVMQALDQLLNQTMWQDLDYLVVDLPPGTGDTQLSLAQKVPVTGAIIVTTPQDIALLDARKGLKMFEKVHIPILGVVENMSLYVCSQCGHQEAIFGEGGAEHLVNDYHVELLGKLPLKRSIRELSDLGKPTMVGAPESVEAGVYRDIAQKIAIKISERSQDMSSKFPQIKVENI